MAAKQAALEGRLMEALQEARETARALRGSQAREAEALQRLEDLGEELRLKQEMVQVRTCGCGWGGVGGRKAEAGNGAGTNVCVCVRVCACVRAWGGGSRLKAVAGDGAGVCAGGRGGLTSGEANKNELWVYLDPSPAPPPCCLP